MPIDPEISLQATPPATANPLTTLDTFAQLQNRLNQNRLFQANFQANQAMGELAQQSVDPATGTVDYNKFSQLVATDPRTAYRAQEVLGQVQQRKLVEQQLTNAKLETAGKSLDLVHGALADAIASKDPIGQLNRTLPAVISMMPQDLQPGVIAATKSYVQGIGDMPVDQIRQVLQTHAAAVKMGSDHIAALYASQNPGGLTTTQALEPGPQIVDPATGQVRTPSRGQAAAGQVPGYTTGGAPTGTGTGAPVTATALPELGKQNAQAESGGVATAKSTTSSALGPHQFTDATWAQVSQRHPELGLTPDGRTKPEQSEKAFEANAQDNAQALSRARLPVNPQNITLAHRFGPQGATAILQAPTDTPVAKVLSPAAVAANNLSGKTTGDLLKSVAGFGSEQSTTAVPSAGVGVVTGLGPEQTKEQTNFADYTQSVHDAVQSMRPLAIAMKAERDASARFQMGGGAEIRGEIAKLLQAAQHAGAPISNELINSVGNGSIADTQTFKAAMTPVIMGQFKQAVQGTGRGLMLEAKAYFERYPGTTTDPAAYENVSNMVARGAQQLVDEEQQIPKFKQGLKSGEIKGYDLGDFPTWYNKQKIDTGELSFPTVTGYAKGSTNRATAAPPAATGGSKEDKLKAIWGG